MSAAVNGSGPVPPRVDIPIFCVGTNKPGSVGRVNGAVPYIVLYSAAVKYKRKYPSFPSLKLLVRFKRFVYFA